MAAQCVQDYKIIFRSRKSRGEHRHAPQKDAIYVKDDAVRIPRTPVLEPPAQHTYKRTPKRASSKANKSSLNWVNRAKSGGLMFSPSRDSGTWLTYQGQRARGALLSAKYR